MKKYLLIVMAVNAGGAFAQSGRAEWICDPVAIEELQTYSKADLQSLLEIYGRDKNALSQKYLDSIGKQNEMQVHIQLSNCEKQGFRVYRLKRAKEEAEEQRKAGQQSVPDASQPKPTKGGK